MRDKIVMLDMRFHAHHGLFEEEHRFGAEFAVDLEVFTRFGEKDEMHSSVDYGALYGIVQRITTGERVNLIETLAQTIASEVLQVNEVEAVTVRVHKPSAPLPGIFTDVYVEIHRERDS